MTHQHTTWQNSSNSKKDYVVVIGDVNVDISASPDKPYEDGEMLFGKVNMLLGGVGRNIALSLQKLGVTVVFLTAFGKDPHSQAAYEEMKKEGIDLTHAIHTKEGMTPAVLQLSDEKGEMKTGIVDLGMMNHLSPDYMKSKQHLIQQARACVLSGNLPKETLNYLTATFSEGTFFYDPASIKKTMETKDMMGQFHTVIPNVDEAEIISGQKLETKEDAQQIVNTIYNSSQQNVVVTLDDGGAAYHVGEKPTVLEGPTIDPVSTTGAGDSFTAGLVYGFYHGKDIEESTRFAIAASLMTLQSELPVHPELSVEELEERTQKFV